MEKKCKFCGNTFEAKRSTAKYCSNSHKVMDFNSRYSENIITYKKAPVKSDNEVLGEAVADFCNKNNCTFEDLKAAFLKPQFQKKAISEPKVSAQPPKQNVNLSFMERRRLQKNGS
jgi:hypothetical protein